METLLILSPLKTEKKYKGGTRQSLVLVKNMHHEHMHANISRYSHSNRKMLHDSLGSGRCLQLFFQSFRHPGCLFRGLLWICAALSPIPVPQVLDATF